MPPEPVEPKTASAYNRCLMGYHGWVKAFLAITSSQDMDDNPTPVLLERIRAARAEQSNGSRRQKAKVEGQTVETLLGIIPMVLQYSKKILKRADKSNRRPLIFIVHGEMTWVLYAG